MSEVPRPTLEQLRTLEGFERVAFGIADRVNRRPLLKRAAQSYLRVVGAEWVHACTKNLVHVSGMENLRSLSPDRGVVLVANHRSFFDLYVIASVFLRASHWVSSMYFPVRGDYFYERPDGVLVNALMSAMAMYPPIMRKPSKRSFNQYSVDLLSELLQHRGTVVGMHPEGTRNKTDDPYTLLPAQPGIGQMVYHAKPIVLPVFILGLSNDLPRQVAGNFTGKGDPITIVFGPPVNLDRFYVDPPRLRTYKKIADHLRDTLIKLGQREKAFRASKHLPTVFSPPKREPLHDAMSSQSS
ncbi:MAG: hypothetical protein NVSMB1_23670 [Polyangiales bacterium]